jgi:hypothetical protein
MDANTFGCYDDFGFTSIVELRPQVHTISTPSSAPRFSIFPMHGRTACMLLGFFWRDRKHASEFIALLQVAAHHMAIGLAARS